MNDVARFELGQGWSVPAAAVEERFVRAGGPGGQNVNKVSSAVELRVDIAAAGLDPGPRERLATLAGRRLSQEGILVIVAQRFRTQERNRADARERLLALLLEAHAPPPPARRPTRPSRAKVAARLDEKARRGAVKAARRTRPSSED